MVPRTTRTVIVAHRDARRLLAPSCCLALQWALATKGVQCRSQRQSPSDNQQDWTTNKEKAEGTYICAT